MPRARLKLEGMDEAIRRVDAVGERARAPEPALRARPTLWDMQLAARRTFLTGRFKPASPEWVARKRREGLSTRTMQATLRLRSALENANRSEGVRFSVFNRELRWGLNVTSEVGTYAAAQARAGRRAVRIDIPARRNVAQRVEDFIAHGWLS